jgi:hypothetical protein
MKIIRGFSEQSISLGMTSFASPEDDYLTSENYYKFFRASLGKMGRIKRSSLRYLGKVSEVGKNWMRYIYTH